MADWKTRGVWCLCRPGADDVLVLRQELVKTQTLMDAVNQDHDKEKEHLAGELADVKHKLHLYVVESPSSSDLCRVYSLTTLGRWTLGV